MKPSYSCTKVYDPDGKPVYFTIRGRTMIKRYYLRSFFDVQVGKHMTKVYGKRDKDHQTRAMLFQYSPLYLKFHEVMSDGWKEWIRHAEWIDETFERIRALGPVEGAVVVGPDVYLESVQRPILRLSLFKDSDVGTWKEG